MYQQLRGFEVLSPLARRVRGCRRLRDGTRHHTPGKEASLETCRNNCRTFCFRWLDACHGHPSNCRLYRGRGGFAGFAGFDQPFLLRLYPAERLYRKFCFVPKLGHGTTSLHPKSLLTRPDRRPVATCRAACPRCQSGRTTRQT